MQKYIGTAIKKDVNNPLPAGETPAVGASVTVRLQSTNAIATIYSDNGVTTISQPLITDSGGRYEFYAANDRYKIEYDYSGATTTIEDVSLLDAVDATVNNSLNLGGVQATNFRQRDQIDFIRSSNLTIEESSGDDKGSASFISQGVDSFVSFHAVNAFAVNFGLSAARRRLGVGGWSLGNNFYELYTAEVFGYYQNASGATIANNEIVAGSALSPSRSGSWRNVSGNQVLNSESGLFYMIPA